MNVEYEPLEDAQQTGKKMKYLVSAFSNDLKEIRVNVDGVSRSLDKLKPVQFFYLISDMPYRIDPRPVEIVSRPLHIFRYSYLGMDCKKKAICIASYMHQNEIPWRFVAVSRRPDKELHHVFVQAKLNPAGRPSPEWVNWDATYENYRPGQQKKITAAEVL